MCIRDSSRNPFEWRPIITKQILNHPADFRNFKPIPPTEGNLGVQLEATKIVIDHFKGKVPVIATTFTDLSFYKDMITFCDGKCIEPAVKYNACLLYTSAQFSGTSFGGVQRKRCRGNRYGIIVKLSGCRDSASAGFVGKHGVCGSIVECVDK